jgi:hypothetical protein
LFANEAEGITSEVEDEAAIFFFRKKWMYVVKRGLEKGGYDPPRQRSYTWNPR